MVFDDKKIILRLCSTDEIELNEIGIVTPFHFFPKNFKTFRVWTVRAVMVGKQWVENLILEEFTFP
jgi:hypothetical protein